MDYFHHYLETIHGFLESLVYIRVYGTFASHSSFHSFISVEPELSSVVFFLGPKPYHPTFSDILRKSFWRARTSPPLSKYGRFSKKWYPKQTSFGYRIRIAGYRIRISGYPDIESGYRIFINCSNLRKVIHTKLDFHWAQIAFNFLEENYAICSHPPSQIYVVWMKLPCRGKYFFRNLWSSRIALRFTVSEWTQSRDWLSSSPGSCGLGKGEGASGTIRMFAAALIPTLEHGFSVAWFQIETKFYFGNHWMENRDFHVTIVQWKWTIFGVLSKFMPFLF